MTEYFDLTKKHCYDCIYFRTECKFDCRHHEKEVSPLDDICDDFKEKVFIYHNIDNWEEGVKNKLTDEFLGINGIVYNLNKQYYLNQELSDENKDWKSKCISLNDFNRILLSELDKAKEQGYEVSDVFDEWIKRDDSDE